MDLGYEFIPPPAQAGLLFGAHARTAESLARLGVFGPLAFPCALTNGRAANAMDRVVLRVLAATVTSDRARGTYV